MPRIRVSFEIDMSEEELCMSGLDGGGDPALEYESVEYLAPRVNFDSNVEISVLAEPRDRRVAR